VVIESVGLARGVQEDSVTDQEPSCDHVLVGICQDCLTKRFELLEDDDDEDDEEVF